jgi:hypothetical protein
MKYLCMIYCNEGQDAANTPEQHQAVHAAYVAYTLDGRAKGVIKAGDPLHPSATATTVRVRDGRTVTSDGPYAETKEQVGGYYMLDCENLDRAIEWAARIPHATRGTIEVRPVLVVS